MNKSTFQKTLNNFWIVTKKYSMINQFHNFNSRQSDSLQQLSFLLFFSTIFFQYFFFQSRISNASKKNQTRIKKTIESIFFNYLQILILSEKKSSETFVERTRKVQLKSIKKKLFSNNSTVSIYSHFLSLSKRQA